MHFTASLPFDNLLHDDPAAHAREFVSLEAVKEVGQALERAGFHAGAVTDHPVPTGRWLDGGGHHAQDPFVMLSLLAASTTRLGLQTGILVLPYRNPFIVARAVSTLDVFSKGRVSLGVGAGYMKGEYKALGVDFERRNELMDEYIAALKAAWTQDEFTFEGTGYQALGNRIQPRPVQQPHPPILIGGNSRRAIRRAAELGDAWYPFFTPAQISSTARTAAMADEEDLQAGIAYLHAHCEKIGRQTPPPVITGAFNSAGDAWNGQALIDRVGELKALGVSGTVASIAGKTRGEWLDWVQRFGEEVIAKV